MSSIVVIRGAGDRKGEDIISPLLWTIEAKLARGTAEMGAHAEPMQSVSLTIVYRPGLRLGQLVEVNDSIQGASWRGKITGISHKMSGEDVVTDLAILRQQKDF